MPARWFERRFEFDLPNTLFPNVVGRVRGTPARIEERVRGVATATLTRRLGETWSIQENVGHLLDLEPLWLTRGRELAAGAAVLTAADLDNRKTHQANHNAFPLAPKRLRTPMRLIDLALFVAEHDDHHLARIGELLRAG